ncbi:MAG TPA: GNAT family N-acetyltransferase [Vineibacter sp.]|nr:GNAT family N-acetyltransferase [Vineibacter sp.]
MDTEALRKAVIDVPERHRYELAVGDAVAFVDYRLTDGVATVPYTEVPPALEGQGVGTALVLGTLDRLREQGRKVAPRCGFFASVIRRHPEQGDLLA